LLLAVGVAHAEPTPTDGVLDTVEGRWGIEMVGVRLSAHDYILDVRFKVVDPDRAQPLFERLTKPILIDQASGAVLQVMSTAKSGPLRTSNARAEAGRVYPITFQNPRRFIPRGAKVTLKIGDFRLEDIMVE
jgi:hypothetical protein